MRTATRHVISTSENGADLDRFDQRLRIFLNRCQGLTENFIRMDTQGSEHLSSITQTYVAVLRQCAHVSENIHYQIDDYEHVALPELFTTENDLTVVEKITLIDAVISVMFDQRGSINELRKGFRLMGDCVQDCKALKPQHILYTSKARISRVIGRLQGRFRFLAAKYQSQSFPKTNLSLSVKTFLGLDGLLRILQQLSSLEIEVSLLDDICKEVLYILYEMKTTLVRGTEVENAVRLVLLQSKLHELSTFLDDFGSAISVPFRN